MSRRGRLLGRHRGTATPTVSGARAPPSVYNCILLIIRRPPTAFPPTAGCAVWYYSVKVILIELFSSNKLLLRNSYKGHTHSCKQSRIPNQSQPGHRQTQPSTQTDTRSDSGETDNRHYSHCTVPFAMYTCNPYSTVFIDSPEAFESPHETVEKTNVIQTSLAPCCSLH